MSSSTTKIGLSLDEIIKQQRAKSSARGRGGVRGVGRRPAFATSKRAAKVSALLSVDRAILQKAGITANKLMLVKKLINRARGFKAGPVAAGTSRIGGNRRGGASLTVGSRIWGRGGAIRGGTRGRGAVRAGISRPNIATGGKKVKLQLRTQKNQMATGASGRGSAVRQRLGWQQRAKRDEMLGQKRGLTIAQNKRVQVGAMRSDLVSFDQRTQRRQNLLTRGLTTRRGRGNFASDRPGPTVSWSSQPSSGSGNVFSRIGNVTRQRGQGRVQQRGNIRREIAARPTIKSRVNPGIRGSFSSNSTRLTLNERFGQGSVLRGRGSGRGSRGGRQVSY